MRAVDDDTAVNPQLARAPDMLRAAAKIYEERKQSYGDNYKHVGTILSGLFPDGIHIMERDVVGLNRLHLIMHMIGKLSRYCQMADRGGHEDSLDDLAVYAMICQECDNMHIAKKRYVVPGGL